MESRSFNKSIFQQVKRDESFSNQYDYAMVFKNDEVFNENGNSMDPKEYKQSSYAKYCVHAMLDKGLEIFTYNSVQGDELIILITCPEAILAKFADNINFRMLMDPDETRNMLKEIKVSSGEGEGETEGIEIYHDPSISPIPPYRYIYAKYHQPLVADNPDIYYRPSGLNPNGEVNTPFTRPIRLKLIYYLLKAPKYKQGCNIPINKLISKKIVVGFYPLRDEVALERISAECMAWSTMPWTQPFDWLRDYFGEKYALYNVFLGHYTHYLLIPSVIGFIFQLVVWGSGNFSHPVLPFFGVVICVWAIVMLEFWKGTEKHTALRWGMLGFEQTEPDRPEYQGDVIDSYITGKKMLYFAKAESERRIALSLMVIGAFIMTVIGVVASIYYMRYALQADIGAFASTVASVVNTVQITVFNMIYHAVAIKLTNLENHRTDTQYQDSMIAKLFVFQFVNSYASFFYLAFIASFLPKPDGVSPNFRGQCGFSNCMQPLGVNLAIIFGTRLVVTNMIDAVMPMVTSYLKLKEETKDAEDKDLSTAEVEYMLLPYDPMMDNIRNYADTAIQFGFMALFITALPIACFFSMVNNYAKLRINAYNMKNYFQRPIPAGAEDIGSWQSIFTIISVVSVITNAGLICFTMNVLTDTAISLTYAGRMWIFVGFQWVLIAVQFICSIAIPDIPEEVEIQEMRTEFIVNKLINGEADDDDDEFGNMDSGKPKTKNTGCPCGDANQVVDPEQSKSIEMTEAEKKKEKEKGPVGLRYMTRATEEIYVRHYPRKELPRNDWPVAQNRGNVDVVRAETKQIKLTTNPLKAIQPAASYI